MAKRILVADDHDYVRTLLRAVLASRGYEVTTVCDGDEALVEVGSNRPDMVLLDVQMPNLDGNEACRILKSNSATSDIPVLLMSGLSDIRDLAWKAGADAFLPKPFELDDLCATVNSLTAARDAVAA